MSTSWILACQDPSDSNFVAEICYPSFVATFFSLPKSDGHLPGMEASSRPQEKRKKIMREKSLQTQ